MRHYMRASCAPQERAPPFVIEIPYADGQVLDNLVIECEDLNDAENPNSLEVALYAQDSSVCGADLCTHEQLSMLTPMRTTSLARKRIFSFGVSSIEMQAMVCAADKCSCMRAAGCSFKLSLVVRCAGTPVRFRVISILTQLALEPGVPVHGEVCPGNWIYHKARIPAAYKEEYGLRFHVHVHEGDVYYVISRWERTPGFAACNENEYAMSFMSDGHADLCDIPTATTNWGGPYEDPSSTSDLLPGYVGLYGGTSCAHYTISTEWLDANSNCSVATTGTCRKRNT
jgi:hypothetical protein